jgi:glycosyltransferase involved in cell wall biosynthesis
VRVLLWHVHGSWTTSFVQGGHEYLLPVTPGRDADGLGRATTWDWPDSVLEVPPARLRATDVDVVVLQRPHELELAESWLGRRPGRDIPAVYVEHNTPKGDVPWSRHPLADRADVPIAHVTHFNALFWDNGRAPVVVVEHGIVDPGELYTGELARVAVAINEPIRRGRVTGTDLLPAFAAVAPLDVFGMKVAGLETDRIAVWEDPPQAAMHRQLARRRVYVHPMRWTSLGLSLLEAMHLGMPVVVVGATEAFDAVPPEARVVSTDVARLTDAVRRYLDDPPAARLAGKAARAAALERYGLTRFTSDWNRLLTEVTR